MTLPDRISHDIDMLIEFEIWKEILAPMSNPELMAGVMMEYKRKMKQIKGDKDERKTT